MSIKPYSQWRTGADRTEDAASAFLTCVVERCRTEALSSIPSDASDEMIAACTEAIDAALHGIVDLLEGFWHIPAGGEASLEFELSVNAIVEERLVEKVRISPSLADLPIGYWAHIGRSEP